MDPCLPQLVGVEHINFITPLISIEALSGFEISNHASVSVFEWNKFQYRVDISMYSVGNKLEVELCRLKEEGRLGFRDLKAWYLALLGRVLWRFQKKHDALWIRWVHHTYLRQANLWEWQAKHAFSIDKDASTDVK